MNTRNPPKAEAMKAAELEQIHATISKAIAESDKLRAETAKINAEARWYPVVAVAGIFAAAFGLLKLLHG